MSDVSAAPAVSSGDSFGSSPGGFDSGSLAGPSFDSAIGSAGAPSAFGSSDPLGASSFSNSTLGAPSFDGLGPVSSFGPSTSPFGSAPLGSLDTLGGFNPISSASSFDSLTASPSLLGSTSLTSDLFSPTPLASTPAPLSGGMFAANDPLGLSTNPFDLSSATPGSFTGLSSSFGPPPNGGWDQTLADITQTGAAAATGYRAGMYGEFGVGPFTANVGPAQQFGRFAPESTLARPSFNGYGIDNFAQRTGWAAPQQTLISSQAAWEYGRQQASALGIPESQIRFESTNPLSPGRTYDVQFERDTPLGPRTQATEIKAGRSINASQFSRDVTAAVNGLDVDYRFAGNPLTGNHGPNPATAARLNAATAATNGNFTWGVENIAPSRAGIQAVETAAQISRAAHVVGRVAVPIGIAADAYSIGSGIAADGGTFGRNATVATASAAGGWGGAAAGGWAGVQLGTLAGAAIGGPVGAPIGAVVGGLIGAIGGGLFGGWGAGELARAATN